MTKVRHKTNVSNIVKSAIKGCTYFKTDCKNLLDKSQGSYVLGYSNENELIDRIMEVEWVKSDKSTDEILIATGLIKGYYGIHNINKLNERDIIFGLPGKTLDEYIPVVLKDKGISLPFLSIVLYKINNEYRYLTISVGNNYKFNSITTSEDLEYKLIGKQSLLDSGCTLVQRVDPSIASNYLVQTALRQELSNNGSSLATLYRRHSCNVGSYHEFIDILKGLKWSNLPGSYTIYRAQGISGYSKYPSLDDLNESNNIHVTEIEGDYYPKLVVDNSSVISDMISLRLFIDNSDIRIIDCYFGTNEKEKLNFDKQDINWNRDFTLEELKDLGFKKARVKNYSNFDNLSLNTIINFIHPWLKGKESFLTNTPECKIKALTDFIKVSERKVFYKSMSLSSDKEFNNQIELENFIKENLGDLGFITSCTSSLSVAMGLITRPNSRLQGNIRFILAIESERWFSLGGVEKEVIVCNPSVVEIKYII